MPLRLLVVEGNTRPARERHRADYGLTMSESYADVLRSIAPDAVCDIAFPTDAGTNLPDAAGLETYDGVVLTGSHLNAYDGGPEVTRQIELARAVYRSGTPMFGSCWGIQIGALAAGGEVRKNPLGRELGFARKIFVNAAGRAHPLLEGRPSVFDAPVSHLDVVATLPAEIVVLASNAPTPVQAAEIRSEGGVFWGVQYHPEFGFGELASIIARFREPMIAEGFCRGAEDHAAYVEDLRALDREPHRSDVAWRLGLDEEVLDPVRRTTEIRNFIRFRVRPEKSRRGRA
jgi:GMP synthase (glutamine-hydrolysing)